jgi:DNA topoisomerase-1
LGCSNYPDCRYTRPLSANADEAAAAAPEEPKEMGNDPDTEEVITLRKGPYGYYLQWGDETTVSAQKAVKKEAKEEEAPKKGKGTKKKKAAKSTKPKPKRVSLPATTAPDDVTLEMALQLKRLPFVVGEHPDSGQRLSVGLGRFGPYVKFGDQFASIPKTYDFLALTLEEAVHIVNAKIQKGVSGTRPKRRKFGGAKKGAAKGKTAKPE